MMQLISADPSNEDMLIRWMTMRENFQWMDFGCGRQELTSIFIKMMIAKESNLVRLFTSDGSDDPIGIVALSNISQSFHTAMLWYILGDKSLSGRRYTARAVNRMLTLAFAKMQLTAVNAWAVEGNYASLRILEINHFQPIGRQRLAHQIEGSPCDRLHFDITADEHLVFDRD